MYDPEKDPVGTTGFFFEKPAMAMKRHMLLFSIFILISLLCSSSYAMPTAENDVDDADADDADEQGGDDEAEGGEIGASDGEALGTPTLGEVMRSGTSTATEKRYQTIVKNKWMKASFCLNVISIPCFFLP